MESPFFPGMNKDPETEAEWFSALINLTRFLRSPEGCPWDREHNAGDFARFSVEEGEELTEALASGGVRRLPLHTAFLRGCSRGGSTVFS